MQARNASLLGLGETGGSLLQVQYSTQGTQSSPTQTPWGAQCGSLGDLSPSDDEATPSVTSQEAAKDVDAMFPGICF